MLKNILAFLLLSLSAAFGQVPGSPPSANGIFWPSWYFFVLSSTPTAHVWSTAAGAYVVVSDAGYLAFIDAYGAPITGAVSNGGLCRITMAGGTGGLVTGQILTTHGISGATGCNVTAAITTVDATHIDLQGTTFGGAYTSGGVIQGFSVPDAPTLNAGINAYNQGVWANKGTTQTSTTITADTQLTNPLSSWNDITNNTSDGLKVILPQANIPGSPPIGTQIIFNVPNSANYSSIRGFGDTSIGTQVLFTGATVIMTLKSNATTDGTWTSYSPTFQLGASTAGYIPYSTGEKWFVVSPPGGPGSMLDYNYASSIPRWTIAPTLGGSTAGGTGSLSLGGVTSGFVTITPQDIAGTYNYNLPITAGSSGQFQTSAGGGSSPMTWSTPAVALNYPLMTFAGGSVNFNTTNTDYPITVASPTTNYRASAIYIYGCSAAITTATFELRTAAAGGGTSLLGGTIAGTATTNANNAANSLQSVSSSGSVATNNATQYFRLVNPQGSGVTCNVDLQIQPLP